MIFKIPGKGYLIHAERTIESGFRIAADPFIQIPEDNTDADAIANAIKEALSNDNNKIPDPKSWAAFHEEYLRKSGLKSLTELYKATTKSISVALRNGIISFTPMVLDENSREGFVHNSKFNDLVVPVTAGTYSIQFVLELALHRCGIIQPT